MAFGGYIDRTVDDYHPEVILKLERTGFEPVAGKMRKPALSSAAFEDLLKHTKKVLTLQEPEWSWDLLRAPTKLAYSGNLDQAKTLFHRVAPWSVKERDEKWAQSHRSLLNSKY